VIHDVDASLGREPDAVHVGRHGTGGAELVRGDRGVVQDDPEQVPEVVCDPSGQPTQALEAFGLREARHQDVTLVLGSQPLGVALAFRAAPPRRPGAMLRSLGAA